MSSMKNILPQIQDLLNNKIASMNESVELSLFRDDGVLLCSTKKATLNDASMGALTAGLWQAAESLMQHAARSEDQDELRLDISTSSSGIFLLPIIFFNEKKCFLAGTYLEVLNPSKIKQEIKILAKSLSHKKFKKSEVVVSATKDQEERFLFNNITDDEIDSLFSL